MPNSVSSESGSDSDQLGGSSGLSQQGSLKFGEIDKSNDEVNNAIPSADNAPNSAISSNNTGDKSSQCSPSATHIRVKRKTNLTLKGKESKISELSLVIVRKMNAQFRHLDTIQRDMAHAVSLDSLFEVIDDLDDKVRHISSLYNELIILCDNDENKINEQTKTMYDHYVAAAQTFKESIEDQIDVLEEEQAEEVEQMIQSTNKEMEEEAKMFQEFLKRRQRNPILPPTIKQRTEARLASGVDISSVGEHSHTPLNVAKLHEIREEKVPTAIKPQTETDMVTQLAQSLAAVIGSNKKSVEPAVFEGNVLEFSDWEIDLDTYLRIERIEGYERLRHLKKFIGGEAKKCIEGHFTTNTNEAYLTARTTLKERYGNERNIARGFRNKLENWPRISPKDGKGLREYSDFLCHLQSAMISIQALRVLNDYVENEKMVEKLPEWLKLKWIRIVAKTDTNDCRYPNFDEFTQFIKEEAHIMTLPISQSLSNQHIRSKERDNKSSQQKAMRSYMASTETVKGCRCCGLDNHLTSDCYRLQEKSKAEKGEFVKKHGLCFKCIEQGHRSKTCEKKLKCLICKRWHATVNHDPNWRNNREHSAKQQSNSANNQQENGTTINQIKTDIKKDATQKNAEVQKTPGIQNTTKQLSCQATGLRNNLTSMAIPVYISAGTGREMLVYALLDNMSDACYISKEVLSTLKPEISEIEKDVTIHMTEDIQRYDDIILRGYMTDNHAHINAYKRDEIYCNREQLPTPTKARKLDHLRCVADQMPPLMDIPVGLLIGMDVPEVIQPLETRPATNGKAGRAFGVKTLFGWTMCGGMVDTPKTPRKRTTYKVDTTKDTELLSILERDFRDIEDGNAYTSQDDIKFLQTLESSTKQNQNGKYIMPLPFKMEPDLPNNRTQAKSRFQGLLKKFKSDHDYHQEYRKFMTDLITAGHAEEAPSNVKEGKVWYMPHFGVRHKQKKKLRVVFDASARFEGVAINDLLLSGPDQMNSLLGILLRFRREPIAISCDIQQMFYNFLVTPEHKDYFRFLWIDDEDPHTIKEYRMNVHLFGAKSSPGVATFGLRKLADDYKAISPQAARFLKEDFYVDDGVTSVATREQAHELIKAAMEICAMANIRLHKFLSNDKEVLGNVPISERGESTKNLNIFKDQLPSERTLGMEWCLDTDCFQFTLPTAANKPSTRRGILSTIAQVYDPMGLVSPFILKGKQILQKVTTEEQSWDQLVSPEERLKWEKWVTDLTQLSKLQIPRCFKTEGNVTAMELHHFSDASLLGYGACSYIRQITDQGKVSCNLILAKSRVAPLKKFTIPRLELQGAVTAVRLANTLRKELKLTINKEIFWTDSKIVLGYIANDTKRFHMYVANRVSEIKQSTKSEQWQYVPTKENPADIASRGATAMEIIEEVKWFTGPAFLMEADLSNYISKNQTERIVSDRDPEVRKQPLTTLASATITSTNLTRRFTKYSSWKRLVHSIAILKGFIRQKKWKLREINSNDLQEAEEFIIRTAQSDCYPAKEKEKSLAKLSPVVDGKNIMRVGGRTSAAVAFSNLQKHPIIIPKQSHLAYLITKHYHEKTFHLGRRSTLSAIRDAGYWIINGTGQVKSLLSKCVGCARLRKNTEVQLMGELPKERLENTPPFTNVGLDVFGPYNVKDRRTELKRWGLLITCLFSRAVHIEILEDMSTDTFIQALRCFTALRGPVRTINCDNGTNFVGAKNEFAKEMARASEEMKSYLLQNHIEFKFNSPDASHQGGATERLIRSVRAVLNGMAMKFKNRLDTKTLRTVFYEAASIVNSRPLTATSIHDPEENIITPNHLLTMKTTPLLASPPGEFPKDEVYSMKRWKAAQQLAQEFWKAWRTEYLRDIMVRQKWTDASPNVKVGDVVIVKDDNAARNDWKLGIITETIQGDDGLVRNVQVKLGNRHLNRNGKVMHQPTVLRRPVQKVVILLRA